MVTQEDINQLLAAGSEGNDPLLQQIIDAKTIDLNVQDSEGKTAVFKAATNGKTTSVAMLLGNGADPDKRTRDNRTTLYASTGLSKGDCGLIIVEKLKAKYAHDPQKLLDALTAKGNSDSYTPEEKAGNNSLYQLKQAIAQAASDAKVAIGDKDQLLSAASEGNDALLQRIIDAKKVDLDVQDFEGKTAVYRAAANARAGSVALLLNNGADPDKRTQGRSPLYASSGNSRADTGLLIVEKLKEKYINAPQKLLDALTAKGSNDTYTPEEKAISNSLAKLQEAIHRTASDAKVAIGDKDQLLSAASEGNDALLQRIIDAKKIDLDVQDFEGKTAVFRAASNGRVGSVALLLNNGADPDKRTQGRGPLYASAGNSRVDAGLMIVEKLKEKYKNEPQKLLDALTAKGSNDSYAPEEKASNNSLTKLQEAIHRASSDAKVAIGDKDQLLSAAGEGNETLLQQIITTGKVDLDVQDFEGKTAIYRAAANGRVGSVALLLNNGVDPDKRTNGRSPLYVSAGNNRADGGLLIVEKLKEKYKNDPSKLLDALTAKASNDTYTPEEKATNNNLAKLAGEINKLVQSLTGATTTNTTQHPAAHNTKPANVSPRVIPKSTAPSPLKLDRTVTTNRLEQTNSAGKTNIEVLGEQGQLGDVFTNDVWMGRREEMDEAWEKIPEKYKNQVNIEVVRSKLSQSNIRDKFKIDADTSWEQGF